MHQVDLTKPRSAFGHSDIQDSASNMGFDINLPPDVAQIDAEIRKKLFS